MCLQEKSLSVCDNVLCSSLLGNSKCKFSFRPSVGASRGLLTLWDSLEVKVWSSVSSDHNLLIDGRFIKCNEEFLLFNVYSPCDLQAKDVLWGSLSSRLQLFRGEANVCLWRL